MRIIALAFRYSFLIILLCSILLSESLPGDTPEKSRLNVLLITIDTLRADSLSCYGGSHVKTPQIDRLASRGILFSRAFAHTPTTLPSHTNILLGTTPAYHGIHSNSDFSVGEEHLTLAELLHEQGYSTGAFVGGWPLDARFGLNQGFETYDCEFDRSKTQLERKADIVIEKALEWLKPRETPWFLWIHCFDPHDPYEPPDPYDKLYSSDLYSGEVAYVDKALGKLWDYLETNSSFENTLTIFTGDHGESLGQHSEETHGFRAYNTTLWVPLIIASPDTKVRRVEDYVCHVDIFPTVCELLNIDLPDTLQGISLRPALKGRGIAKRTIYFESLYPYYSLGWAPIRGYIEKKEKFIESPIPELYDLERDFQEYKNLAGEKKLDSYRKKLEQLILDQASPEIKRKQQHLDRRIREKLASLGYISYGLESRKKDFGPHEDVKVTLPFSNRATAAARFYKQGQASKAVDILREILTERKDIPNAYTSLANIYQDQGRLQDAIEVLNMGLENIPSSYTLFFELLKNLADAEQYDLVIKKMNENNFQQKDYDPAIWNILGNAYYAKSDLSKAEENYRKALALDEGSPLLLTNLGNVKISLSQSARSASGKENLKTALQLFEKAISIDPGYAEAYFGLGRAYRQVGWPRRSIQALEKANELNPDSDEILFYLGNCYLENNQKTAALRLFKLLKKRSYPRLPPELRTRLDALIEKAKK